MPAPALPSLFSCRYGWACLEDEHDSFYGFSDQERVEVLCSHIMYDDAETGEFKGVTDSSGRKLKQLIIAPLDLTDYDCPVEAPRVEPRFESLCGSCQSSLKKKMKTVKAV